MKSSDNHVFWGTVLLFIGFYYCLKMWIDGLFLFTHWIRIGFFAVLALRFFLADFLRKRKRAVLVQADDEREQLCRLKAYRAALGSCFVLLLLGLVLAKWVGNNTFILVLSVSFFAIILLSWIVSFIYGIISSSDTPIGEEEG